VSTRYSPVRGAAALALAESVVLALAESVVLVLAGAVM
jgi:hypothetical protein